MSRRLIAGVFVCLFLLWGTPATASSSVSYPRTLEEVAAYLQQDPILVHSAMGTGDTEGVDKLLTGLAAKLDVPVYIVLTTLPAELADVERQAEQATAVLHAELGDGLYYVAFNEGSGYEHAYGAAKDIDFTPGLRAFTRSRDLGPQEYNVPTRALEAELILRSAAQPGKEFSDAEVRKIIATPHAFEINFDDQVADQQAKRWVYAVAAAVIALSAGLTIMLLAAKAPLQLRRPKRDDPDLVPSKFDDTTLPRVHRRFDALAARDLGSPHAVSAEEALTAADLAARTGDELDTIGAWVLALYADRELERIAHPTRAPYRPCVINPKHGEASTTIRLAGSSIDAPACQVCGEKPTDFLLVSTWRGRRHYLDTSSVWARTGFGALVDDLARQVLDDRSVRR